MASGKISLNRKARKSFLGARLFLGALLFPVYIFANSVQAVEVYSPKNVIELFTSQGCSSCPPADKFISDIYRNKDVLALAWHVDYWDYLGWKDTFSKSEYTKRQRNYAISFGTSQIYTPQMVIDGRTHVVGSRVDKIKKILNEYNKSSKNPQIPVNVNVIDNNRLDISVSPIEGGDKGKIILWIAYFSSKNQVKVERGENRGKNIIYSNIVQDNKVVGMMRSDGLKIMLPLDAMHTKDKDYDSCALILQRLTKQGSLGSIIGATVIRDL